VAASSGPDTKDLRRKSGQPELRRGTDSAETSGAQATEPDKSGRRSAKGGKSDPAELYREGSQSEVAAGPAAHAA